MNNNINKKEIPIILKKPSLNVSSVDVQRRRPLIPLVIVNPFTMWNDKLASTKEGAYLQGYNRGLRSSGRTFSELKNGLSSPGENPLGEFTESLAETLTLKESFVLGFIQGINRKND